MKPILIPILVLAALAAGRAEPRQATSAAVWNPDRGDGTYTNPVIFADYSDPDVVRAGDDFYLVSSSFQAVPGLPILHSRDLVNWTIVGHALETLPSPRYDVPRHGEGVWAPSLRYHGGFFWIYWGDPDLGIFMTKTRDPRGRWDPPVLVRQARGWIDPAPLWDDDGSVYLVHAWAKSRAGFNAVLTVNRLTPDGTRIIDDGRTVFESGNRHPTIEGPKFYKRNGYYYIFAPAGGVKPGWQTVLRSRRVYGPYEDRIVLHQGRTAVNGPHQGAWVQTSGGEAWFVHFQDRGPYGRIVHLQPMQWKDDWPVIGADEDGDGTGEPVSSFRKPNVKGNTSPAAPQTSDEFNSDALGLQWQWQANPRAEWFALGRTAGALRLFSAERPATLWGAGNLLLQKFPAEAFTATASVDLHADTEGDATGLLVMGRDYAYISVERRASGWEIVRAVCPHADAGGTESAARAPVSSGRVLLRAVIAPGAVTTFSYSTDGAQFTPLGEPFTAREGTWIGAKIGLFASGPQGISSKGFADVDWFHITK